MAENKKSFVLYADLIHTVNKMPNDKAGELLKHILSYVNDENPDTDDLIIQLTFEPIKQQLKRDLFKYEKKKEQWSEAGKRSAEARKVKKNQRTLTNVESRSTDSTVNDSVNVNVNDITTTEEVDFILVDGWVKEISKSPTYLEGLYRLHKLNNGSISKLTNNFKEHLKVYPTKHSNFSDFRKHFASWLQIKNSKGDLSKYQKQTKGQL